MASGGYTPEEMQYIQTIGSQWDWHEGKERLPKGTYILDDQRLAIAAYVRQFGRWPPAGLSADQKKYVRRKEGLPTGIKS